VASAKSCGCAQRLILLALATATTATKSGSWHLAQHFSAEVKKINLFIQKKNKKKEIKNKMILKPSHRIRNDNLVVSDEDQE
jgi:hypothetical protein